MMNLLLLTFGDKLENHYQASFAILSFLKDPLLQRVIVITDRPEFYRLFGDRVDLVDVDRQTLKDWQAPHQFFWRIKIKAVELAVSRYPGQHLMYVDSDTFLATGLAAMQSSLDTGVGFMHLFENELGQGGSRTLERMFRSLGGRSFAGVHIDAQSRMWNAGVVALPAPRADDIVRLSLQLCDEMCGTDCPRRLIEQFAFSVALDRLIDLQSCQDVIGHYWGNKSEWDLFILRFLASNLLCGADLDSCIEQIRHVDWNGLPLEKRPRSSIERIKRWLDGTFKVKRSRYFHEVAQTAAVPPRAFVAPSVD
ncbi:MAG: hypothetical protein Q4A16_08665 [Lautropia sp.]|nr:hypothetical protein [Lautropia sp.]